MKKEFKKTLELGMEIASYRKDEDNHVFTISFDKNIGEDEEINSLEIHPFLATDKSWFQSDYCCRVNHNDFPFGYDVWEEGNYHFLKCLFDSEKNFYTIIQEMCIDYCKEYKLPDCYMSTLNEDEITTFASDIMDMIEKSGVDTTSSFNVIGKYYENYPFKETEFSVCQNSLKLKNELVNMDFVRRDDEYEFDQFIDRCTVEFMNKWNEDVQGKFDWIVEKKDV